MNPTATTTSERVRDVLVRALKSAVDLTVEYTTRRGHAADLAADAAQRSVGLVVTLGGDGTVNEVVNGLLRHGTDADAPALAVVPGGSTNVFARALGMPADWADGAGAILEALHEERFRTVSLGRANGRYFTFCAGLGLDAAAIRRVERARVSGHMATPALYVRSALAQYVSGSDRHDPNLTMEIPGRKPVSGLALAIVQNTSPWTYLGGRPISPNPHASFDSGLDVLSMRALSIPATIRTATQLLTGSTRFSSPAVISEHDLEKFRLFAARPHAFQLDGDYVGECDEVEMDSVRDALRVVC